VELTDDEFAALEMALDKCTVHGHGRQDTLAVVFLPFV
jgi:hypothetical protein